MSSKESLEIVSVERGRRIAKAVQLSFLLIWLTIPLVGGIWFFRVWPDVSAVIVLLIFVGIFVAFTVLSFVILFAVLARRPSVSAVILKHRNYIGSLKDSNLHLKSQIMNSAIAYSNKVMAEVNSAKSRHMSVMLIDQGAGSPGDSKSSPAAWLLYDIVLYASDSKNARHRGRLAPPPDYTYTAIEMRLKRPVPRLIFDSPKASGSQFRRLYSSSQRLSFDAAAEKTFTAYVPEGYQIETLSFITPEVTLAMLEMADCDIEFIGDSLVCYGRLLRSDELESLKAKCFNLYGKVNDNLAPLKRKALKIDPWGYHLLKNPLVYLPALISAFVGGLVSLAILLIGHKSGVLYLGLSVVSMITVIVKMYNNARQNRRIREYLQQRRAH